MQSKDTGERAMLLVLLLHMVKTGVLFPVQSLVLLRHGLGLGQIALAVGCYSAAAILCEVPSGILSDRFGRKRMFCLAQCLMLAALLLLLVGRSAPLLFGAMLLNGIARAFSSGSVDALVIEAIVARDAVGGYSRASARLAQCESVGLAVGSLLGSTLPVLALRLLGSGNEYELNVAAALACTACVLALSAALVRERGTSQGGERPTLGQMAAAARGALHGRMLGPLFAGVAVLGFALMPLEIYWQPRLSGLLPEGRGLWVPGVLAFLYFLASALGAQAAQRLLRRRGVGERGLYIAARGACALALGLLAAQRGLAGFCVLYVAFYFALGVSNVPEGALVGRASPPVLRSSLLSLQSLVLQVGGLCASALGTAAGESWGIGALWALGACALLLCCAGTGLLLRRAPDAHAQAARAGSEAGTESESLPEDKRMV